MNTEARRKVKHCSLFIIALFWVSTESSLTFTTNFVSKKCQEHTDIEAKAALIKIEQKGWITLFKYHRTGGTHSSNITHNAQSGLKGLVQDG